MSISYDVELQELRLRKQYDLIRPMTNSTWSESVFICRLRELFALDDSKASETTRR